VNSTLALAARIAEVSYDSLPEPVIRAVREAVLDGMATMLVGSTEPIGGPLLRYTRALGGPPESTVIGHSHRTHPVHAAFVNGCFGHVLDYEFVWQPPTHPNSTSLPAFLALAEQRGFPGQDIAVALAVAFEVQGRLRLAINAAGYTAMQSLHPPGQVGPFGAAAGCARLLGFETAGIANALAIAASRVAGLGANTGSMTKASHSGHAARMGLESALLTEAGFTGGDDIFDAPQGYNDILFQGALDMEPAIRHFGRPFRMVDPGVIVKKYPAQYLTHWSVDAALNLRERHRLEARDVASAEVEVGANNRAADRLRPGSVLEAKFSLPYTVAAALIDGRIDFDTFREERFRDPQIRELMERITIQRNPDVNALDFSKAWSRVTVHTRDGRTLTERVDRPLGIWDNPLPWQGRVAKFRDCARFVLDAEAADEVVALIERFETLEGIARLMRLVQGPASDIGAGAASRGGA